METVFDESSFYFFWFGEDWAAASAVNQLYCGAWRCAFFSKCIGDIMMWDKKMVTCLETAVLLSPASLQAHRRLDHPVMAVRLCWERQLAHRLFPPSPMLRHQRQQQRVCLPPAESNSVHARSWKGERHKVSLCPWRAFYCCAGSESCAGRHALHQTGAEWVSLPGGGAVRGRKSLPGQKQAGKRDWGSWGSFVGATALNLKGDFSQGGCYRITRRTVIKHGRDCVWAHSRLQEPQEPQNDNYTAHRQLLHHKSVNIIWKHWRSGSLPWILIMKMLQRWEKEKIFIKSKFLSNLRYCSKVYLTPQPVNRVYLHAHKIPR